MPEAMVLKINRLIDELEEELCSKRGLFAKKIDVEKCAAIVEELKSSVPSTLSDVNYILDNKQKILDNADTVAKNTIKAAEERARQLAQSTEVARLARVEANRLLDETSAECDMLINKTKEHLDKTFLETEQFLLSTLNMIRTNREELRKIFIYKNNKC